ncbi:MAG TPA: acetate--CoA ligase family protein [Thermoanaerobaculia bacterium]|jgi:acetyl coenzyme A synthetase (ADP forming)-like protein|nr:acetate--CoA ligase family protein [Thermoanaerobaculia bacterium]
MTKPTDPIPSRPLDAIFSPRSVAVIGASRRRDSIGFSLLRNLIASEFNGTIFPVNPSASSIHSLKCYPSVEAIPDPVDLAVILVPKKLVPGVVDECLAKKVRGLVVITAGFSETGEEGARNELALRGKVRAVGVRMIGPNCMGVINTDAGISLNATFAPTPARPGSIGFVSQSGALGVAILNVAQDLGIGLTQFVSMGNKADVSGNDLIEHWEDDPATRVICMYLESFGNPRRFTEIAKRVSRKKPILVVKSGRTAEGARAASSHTGAIAGTDVTVSAFLDQCGVLRANTIEELFDIARALDRSPLPEGNRVGIVTNAGGPAIMATDACVNLGLRMAELSDATRAALRAFLPAEASVANPVDMIASANAESYTRGLAAVLDDPGVDMAMVINVTPLLSNPIDVLEAAGEVARTRSKPVLAVMMATDEFYETAKTKPDLPPVYRFPESAARALFMLARYGAWRRRPDEAPVAAFDADDKAVEEILDRTPEGYLEPADVFRVLDLYGIPLARWQAVATPEEALAAARQIGYPVVLKAIAPDLVHKSDVGAVRVDLRTEEELSRALAEMTAALVRAGHRAEGFLVQEMARGGHEVIFGITTDPRFGPLLMFGLGGKYVEVFQDVRFGVPPLAGSEARDMIAGIRGFKLLEGVRGEPGADLEVLADVLLRLAQLVERHPRLRELDINPFLAGPDRQTARALDARLRVGPVTPPTTEQV